MLLTIMLTVNDIIRDDSTWRLATLSHPAEWRQCGARAATVGYNAGIPLYLIIWEFTLLTFFAFNLKIEIRMARIGGVMKTYCGVYLPRNRWQPEFGRKSNEHFEE